MTILQRVRMHAARAFHRERRYSVILIDRAIRRALKDQRRHSYENSILNGDVIVGPVSDMFPLPIESPVKIIMRSDTSMPF